MSLRQDISDISIAVGIKPSVKRPKTGLQNTPNHRLKPSGKFTSEGKVRRTNTSGLKNSSIAMSYDVSPEARPKVNISRANMRSAVTKRNHHSSMFARNLAETELTNVVLTQ